jgi:hypothetical protein
MGFDGLPWDLSVNGTSAEPAGSALHPSVTSFKLKKALMNSSHSGVPRRGEPGIQTKLLDSGSGPSNHPGMTKVMHRAHTWLKKA